MIWRVLADTVLILHLLFVVFVVLGGWLVVWRPRLIWFHLPVLAWGIWIEFSGAICPLTPLENWLRDRGGETGYSGGFIEHYITDFIYPSGLTRGMQFLLGGLLIVINLAAYGMLWNRRRRKA
jgi:Protein of Unknown function (DUF2784)